MILPTFRGEVGPLRRILLVFSLLLAALVGLGEGGAALTRGGAPGAGLLEAGAVPARPPSKGQPCPRCHARCAIPRYGAESTRAEQDKLAGRPGSEPVPWPRDLVLALSPVRGVRPVALAWSACQSPGLPEPLLMGCVLRI